MAAGPVIGPAVFLLLYRAISPRSPEKQCDLKRISLGSLNWPIS